MESRSYSRYLLVVLSVAIVFTAIILVALNSLTDTNRLIALGNNTSSNNEDALVEAYRSGFNAARERFEKYGLTMISGQTNILIGEVLSVNSNGLVVMQENLMTDNLVDGVPNDRDVVITAETKIFSETSKSPEHIQSEQEAFDRQSPTSDAQPPVPTIRTQIQLRDIKPGDRVRVLSSEVDVTLLDSISAQEIIVTGQ